MKKLLLVLTAICMTFAATAAEQTKKLRILMIGNSFSVCVADDLHQIVKKTPDCKLLLTSAYIGGCTLKRHWQCIEKAEKDANYKPYDIRIWDTDQKRSTYRKDNVNNLLKEEWDIISIQQGSSESWNFKFYEPAAGKLIAYIKKHVPKAEIVIQQTWAYRVDDGRLRRWKISQTEMYEKVSTAYRTLAEKYKFRVIPTGDAVQLYRKANKIQSTAPTAEQDPKKLVHPALPDFNNDIVGNSSWRKDKKTGKLRISSDPAHLNRNGRYMQACVWFCALFEKTGADIKYFPKSVPNAKNLIQFADEAVKNYKQVK
jgi:hypothetical protein